MSSLVLTSAARVSWSYLQLFVSVACLQAAVEVRFEDTPAVFGNSRRSLPLRLSNTGPEPVEAHFRFRLYQASVSTLIPVGETQNWRTLKLDAGQTVVETFEMACPAVQSETSFHVIWFDGEKKLGTAQVRAFPQGLLKGLATVVGENLIGLVDPDGKFRESLGSVAVATRELREAEDINASEAHLIFVAALPAVKWPAGLRTALKKKAASGAAVVWLQPATPRNAFALPDVYVVGEGEGRIVIASETTVRGLAESPRAQLNLVRLAELATGRQKLELPPEFQP